MIIDEGVEKALNVAYKFGTIDGDHHKMWVIDQMVRALTGKYYDEWVIEYGIDGDEWDIGIAP